MLGRYLAIALGMAGLALPAQPAAPVELGRLPTGATVRFVQSSPQEWGIEITSGVAPAIQQPKPVRLELYQSESDIRAVAAGYGSVEKTASGVDAVAEIRQGEGVVFRVADRWTLQGAVVSLQRNVKVNRTAPGGFATSIVLAADPSAGWADVSFLAPGLLYGDPSFNGERSPGGTMNHAARRFLFREDFLPAPLFALYFRNGASIALLDPAPRGDTTMEESRLVKDLMTDGRFQFGAFGAWQKDDEALEFGFLYPGTATSYTPSKDAPPRLRWLRRYHPVAPETQHAYQVSFRFGQNESFREMTRNSWRWAWETLKPPVYYTDIEQLRRVLTDHLAAQAATIDGRTAIPFVLNTVSDQLQWNWTMAAMGFVGKNLECADQLLRESDRDPSERGKKMRQTALAVISSMIQALSSIPLQATGYDLATGKPHDHIWLAPWLRNASEDMHVLLRAYQRERSLGRDHPEWFNWIKSYADWLLGQQREDGSFPRRWQPGSNEVAEPTGTTSYAPVPLLVRMSEVTGDPKYRLAAARAAEYVWSNWGTHGLYVGGASDNPNITDKEAGMLSMEAFLSLYEATRHPKWLERAKAAADFAETWMWIWNLPMPVDATDDQLHWKKGVPTVGVQGITAMAAGGADQYLDWAVPSYAKLYNLTKDGHYLDVARILLHNTKIMVALPGRQYDMKGIGWQQEGWRMGPGGGGRGVGGHRLWLPWVSSNHLYGITVLEEYDPVIFQKLAARPGAK